MSIEQVVTCWLYLELAQALYGAGALSRALDRRVSAAQRRYFKAMDALSRYWAVGPMTSPVDWPAGDPSETGE